MPMSNILIVDDDRLVREATQIMLRAQGYGVAVAADGQSAIDAVRSSRFDLAIVDLFMPGMNGLQVIKAIRQSCPDMQLIVASGFMLGDSCPRMPEFDAMAAEAGAVATLYKPLRPRQVLAAVEDAISAGKYRKASVA